MTIFKFPTLANPDALNEQELREELKRVNQSMLSLSEELNAQRYTSQRMADLMAQVVTARTMKNQEEMNRVVDGIIEKYVVRIEPQNKSRVH